MMRFREADGGGVPPPRWDNNELTSELCPPCFPTAVSSHKGGEEADRRGRVAAAFTVGRLKPENENRAVNSSRVIVGPISCHHDSQSEGAVSTSEVRSGPGMCPCSRASIVHRQRLCEDVILSDH